MFRNLRLFRIDGSWPDSEQSLSTSLEENAFEPCGRFSERSAGWEAPGGEDNPLLCRRLMGADLLQLRTQSRIIPAAAVKEALEQRVAEFRQRTRLEPPRRELTRMKMETRDELIGRALLKSERARACAIPSASILAVDVATASKAEWLLDQLRPCLPTVRCTPLEFDTKPDVLMKRMFQGDLPKGFRLGLECRMQSPADARTTGTWRNVELSDAAIQRHVADGMRLTHLGLVFDEVMSFVLSEDGSISKLDLLQGDDADSTDEQEPLAAMDADFALLAGSVQRLVAALQGALAKR
jgi:recombination associated protein RdgC